MALARNKEEPVFAKKGMSMTAPLHHAASTNDMETLNTRMVNTPDDPFDPDPYYGDLRETPLMLASYNGSLEAVKKFCEFPCEPIKENKNKENCLHYASMQVSERSEENNKCYHFRTPRRGNREPS